LKRLGDLPTVEVTNLAEELRLTAFDRTEYRIPKRLKGVRLVFLEAVS
jgi:hypothetical protein